MIIKGCRNVTMLDSKEVCPTMLFPVLNRFLKKTRYDGQGK